MDKLDSLPAVLWRLVVVKPHDKRESRDPIVLVERLDAVFYHPMPLVRPVWRELPVRILADQPDAAGLKAALYADVVVRAGLDYL